MGRQVTMMTDEAIDRVLDTLRRRMKDAITGHQRIHMHAKAGVRPGSIDEDGSFAFTMMIDKRDDSTVLPLEQRCVYHDCSKRWEHERKSGGNVYRLCTEHNDLLFKVPSLGPPRWICKECGNPRRRGECLSCGNVKPVTDEPMTPGISL